MYKWSQQFLPGLLTTLLSQWLLMSPYKEAGWLNGRPAWWKFCKRGQETSVRCWIILQTTSGWFAVWTKDTMGISNDWKFWHVECWLFTLQHCSPAPLPSQARLLREGEGRDFASFHLHHLRDPKEKEEECRIWGKTQKLARKMKYFNYFIVFSIISTCRRQCNILSLESG